MVGDEADGLEAAGLQAAGDAFEHPGVDVFRDADGAGEAQVPGRRVVIALRHIGDDWRHQRLAQFLGDLRRRPAHDVVVLAEHHVRTVLLDAAARHDH
jgi:hypothetical protein